jgi:hypothetical protein
MTELFQYSYGVRTGGLQPRRREILERLIANGHCVEASVQIGDVMVPVTVCGVDGDGMVVEGDVGIPLRKRTLVCLRESTGRAYFMHALPAWQLGSGAQAATGLVFLTAPTEASAD